LQENVVFSKIASSVTSNILSYLQDKAKSDAEGYNQFWKEHGRVFKLGYTDFTNHEKYVELLRFNSSASKDKDELMSFADYASRMKEGQKEIYYISGSSREAVEADPHMEIFRNKGLEVLYLYDPIDEIAVQTLRKYKDFDLKSIDIADMKKIQDLSDVEKKEKTFDELESDDKKHFFSLLSKMKSILGERVTDVKESKRLVDSASCLVSEDDGMSNTMQKILRMTNKEVGPQKKIMEVNPDHKLTRNLLKVFKADANDDYIINITEQLFESALLQEGILDDPHNLVRRMNKLLEQSSDWYTNIKKL
jgi:molecular chaperone HtpG